MGISQPLPAGHACAWGFTYHQLDGRYAQASSRWIEERSGAIRLDYHLRLANFKYLLCSDMINKEIFIVNMFRVV